MSAEPFQINCKDYSTLLTSDLKPSADAPMMMGDTTSLQSPVGRIQQDLRTIAVGLECYYIDNNCYPDRLSRLTTPVAYLTRVPKDLFGPAEERDFRYKTDAKRKWILQSHGPDGDYDMDLQLFLDSDSDAQFLQPQNPGAKYLYDPTNGTVGGGDIMRVGP